MSRRGFTLVELLVVIALAGVLGALFTPLLLGAGRINSRAQQRLRAERAAMTVHALMIHDFRAASRGDISIPATGRIDYDRPVGEGLVCQASLGTVTIPRIAWLGDRLPAPGRDQLWLLGETAWARVSLSDVLVGICPDGRAAMVLQGAWSFAASHARAVEPVTLSHYQSGDSWWLGMRGRLGLGTTQPFAGPAPAGSWQPTLEAELLQVSFSPGDSMTSLTLPLEPVP